MRNLLMVLVAVLGTSAMVHAFPAKTGKETPAKEVKATKHPKKHKSEKKAKSAKSETAKTETPKAEVKK
ncbi:hypothetical protein [Flavobacterium ginsenosidimutans]|uniref:Acid-shock protein n=1 Tax=Flavobacterium ginsenosidimutans TaxID=687844 RepID=A0ABZ2QDI5_9FLAO|nr:hypothetical protein [Flavobacterium ginsenosidimutans]KAF2329515.1 hypothetical protein DM444_14810 [Flavobacterium ginsenosidimutans]